jgi:uncharacterized protein YwgA
MTKDIPSLVQLAGGEIVGKIRLQKEIYLLDQIGLRSGFSFEYHHYGPYSEELAEQVEDDIIFGRLNASPGRRVSDGVPYVIYRANRAGDGDRVDRYLSLDQIRSALAEMQRCSATVLELAATIHWLAFVEARKDWKEELVRRKGAKTQDSRDRQAFNLLSTLGLSPAA